MIDIIIPAYNAYDTIVKTLSNISLQTYKDKTNIYIVNDCSTRNYSKEIKLFSGDLNIKELKTPKNVGPGKARSMALKKTKGKYIIFIDADDQFAYPFTIEHLYEYIEKGRYDVVFGDEAIEDYGIHEDHSGSLHGKIYRRSFLEKFKIDFNNTRLSEDDSFNKMCFTLSRKTKKIDELTYIYMNNLSSITNVLYKKPGKMDMYVYNMIWLVESLEKRRTDPYKIARILLYSYAYLFNEISKNRRTNYNNIFYSYEKYDKLFAKYSRLINKNKLASALEKNLYTQNCTDEEMLEKFEEFRKNFGKYKSSIAAIVPVFNENDDMEITIKSLVQQSILNKFRVYIVDNFENKDYSDLIKKYKDYLKIEEIKAPSKFKVGGMIQYAINKARANYLLFVESGDYLCNGLCIRDLYEYVHFSPNDIYSSYYFEQTGGYFKQITSNYNKLYGKIYLKNFLIKNNIKLLNINTKYDFAINRLLQAKENYIFANEYTYIHVNKRIETDIFEDTQSAIDYICDEGKRRKYNYDEIGFILFESIFKEYELYIKNTDEEIRNTIIQESKYIKNKFVIYTNIMHPETVEYFYKVMTEGLIRRLGIMPYIENELSFFEFLDIVG